MRHLNSGSKLGRQPAHRRATLRNLVTNVIEKERITTTVTRAKAAQPLGRANHHARQAGHAAHPAAGGGVSDDAGGDQKAVRATSLRALRTAPAATPASSTPVSASATARSLRSSRLLGSKLQKKDKKEKAAAKEEEPAEAKAKS